MAIKYQPIRDEMCDSDDESEPEEAREDEHGDNAMETKVSETESRTSLQMCETDSTCPKDTGP